jgi:hypothetical protein
MPVAPTDCRGLEHAPDLGRKQAPIMPRNVTASKRGRSPSELIYSASTALAHSPCGTRHRHDLSASYDSARAAAWASSTAWSET